MPRKSADAERRLLDAARAMVGKAGLRGLRLRAVARRAGVNVGLFPYHFGTKRAFVRRLLQGIYEEFFGRLSLESSGGGDCLERLRRALLVFGRFARDQRQLFVSLLAEALDGDKDVVAYLEANVPRHARVIAGLIAEGQRRGRLKALPLPLGVTFALGGMGAPSLLVTAVERGGSPGVRRSLSAWRGQLLSDRAIARRAELVLAGLRR
ncbi:MAG: TetR/AcrR family transcriptional regulator [Elusimicrobia bacterium]|nr:TetR/AcrR family transcriptional regulator [Elusimicrobiota bacterium]MDE2426802.1 TetR/AcrR family transcriptional regulator [Elusimicrobiota bacterium]